VATLFISDLHIDADSGVDTLAQMLAAQPSDLISELYILGDLFETWIGDDDDHPIGERVAQLLSEYQAIGWRVHFLPGNRDFLVGHSFLSRFDGRMVSDPSVVDLYGHRVLLLHGDRECLADHAYQAVRQKLRDPDWQSGFLAQSLQARREFAQQARAQSQAHTSAQSASIMDADADEIARLLELHRAEVVIHGHTHRPAVHALGLGGRSALRVVLGDWHSGPSWLLVDADGFRLHAENAEISVAWPRSH